MALKPAQPVPKAVKFKQTTLACLVSVSNLLKELARKRVLLRADDLHLVM